MDLDLKGIIKLSHTISLEAFKVNIFLQKSTNL